jgi:hypothetical protein
MVQFQPGSQSNSCANEVRTSALNANLTTSQVHWPQITRTLSNINGSDVFRSDVPLSLSTEHAIPAIVDALSTLPDDIDGEVGPRY